MKIKLVLLDRDREYLSRLMAVLSHKYPDKLEIYSFTEMKMALDILKTVKADVFLANEEFEIDEKILSEKCGFAYIAEDSDVESIREHRAVSKYQRVDLFYKNILNIYAENSSKVTGYKSHSNKVTQIITFMSAEGGAGSSLLAAAFARYVAGNGKKVLYLNMEQLGCAEDYFNGEGRLDFSDVIYAVKSKKANLALKLESIVKQDSSGVYFYSSSKVALDLLELDEEDICIFIQELCNSGIYDYIVMDVDCSFDKRTKSIMEFSQKIILVSDDMAVSNSKLKRLYDALVALESQGLLNVLDKLFLVYNKSNGDNFRINEVPDIKCLGSVPHFEGESLDDIENQVVSVNWFKELLNVT